MGLFDEIKDKLTGHDDDKAAPTEEKTPEERQRIDRELASNEATARAAADELKASEDAEKAATAAQESAAASAAAQAEAKAQADQKLKADQDAAAKAAAEQKAASQKKAAADAAARAPRTYTVKPDDNLSTIAQKYGVNYMDIARANNIKNPDLIHPGQVFTIPE